MVQKFPNLLVLEEVGTETVFPVLRAYGLVCATRGTNTPSHCFIDLEMITKQPC